MEEIMNDDREEFYCLEDDDQAQQDLNKWEEWLEGRDQEFFWEPKRRTWQEIAADDAGVSLTGEL
jgi:hypothetical protein